MSKFTVTRNIEGKPTTVEVEFDLGTTLDEAIDKFGPEAIHTAFIEQATATITKEIRRVMQGGIHGARRMSQEQIQAYFNTSFKLGQDPVARERTLLAISKLTGPVRAAALAAANATEADLELLAAKAKAAKASAPSASKPAAPTKR